MSEGQEKIERLLGLVRLLSEDKVRYTVEDMADRLDMSTRTIYRYIETFRGQGFSVKYDPRYKSYSFDKEEPEIAGFSQLVRFNEEERAILDDLFDSIEPDTQIRNNLRRKLNSIYNYSGIARDMLRGNMSRKAITVGEAITGKCQVILENYSSSHSGTRRDRKVEPYEFSSDFTRVWCYDVGETDPANANKVFNLSRCSDVVLLENPWNNEKRHRKAPKDLFRCDGPDTHHITLKIGRMAYNLLREEYPISITLEEKPSKGGSLKKCKGEDKWILDTDVHHYEGAGRFVIGLKHDIEIIDSPGLEGYIRNYLADNLNGL